MSPWLSDLFLGSQSDERLAALARAGHQRAFTAIVERYRRELNAQARRLDAQRSDDLVQQTFLCAFSALQEDTEVRHVRGWLYRILRNLASQPARSSVAETELDEAQAVTESAQQIAERKMLAFATLAEIARLPAHQHDALIQTAIQGRARAEVADRMGISEGAVRQLVHRARATLRTAVTAITPLPLARWFADARQLQGPVGAEAAIGPGTASAGGIAVKLGTVIASGVLATGVVTAIPQHHGSRASRPRVHAANLEGARQPPSAIAERGAPAEPRLALGLDSHPFGRPDRASKEKGIGRDGSSQERHGRPEDRGSPSGADRRDGGNDSGSSSSASGDGSDRASGSASGPGSPQTGSHDGGGPGSDGGSSPMATISSDGGSSSGSGSSGSRDGSSPSASSGAGATSDGGGGTSGADTSTTSATTGSSGG